MPRAKNPKRYPCQFCGRMIVQVTNAAKYCSRNCQRRGRRSEQGRPESPCMWRSEHPQPCRVCGEPTLYRYCSKKCRNFWKILMDAQLDPKEVSKQPPVKDREDLRAESAWQRKQEAARA